MNQNLKRLRAISKQLEPTVFIARGEVSHGVIEEIKKQLKTKKIIKIKVKKDFFEGKDRSEAAEALANEANALLVDRVGFTITLSKIGYMAPSSR